MLKYVLIIGLLLAFGQDKPMTDDEYAEWRLQHWAELEQVEQDRRNMLPDRPKTYLVTVIAQYGDGTPVRGYISCEGSWCKYDEEEYCGDQLPFKTDARGACIFNPALTWVDDNGEPMMHCYASAGLRMGKLSFPIHGGIHTITIPGSR